MAIHLPLSAARISAFSTHTAHPEFVQMAQSILSRLLSFDINVENPFLYMTKGQVVQELVGSHASLIELAVSCWKASRVSGGLNHCGFCMPCLVRRIGLETNGLRLAEYRRDILAEDISRLPPDDDAKRNVCELAEFVTTFEGNRARAELEEMYPELVNGSFDADQAIGMYRRFAVEARGVFDRYPNAQSVLR